MKLVSTLLMFIGYTLIYSAVAEGGLYAVDPWYSLIGDAYTGGSAANTSNAQGGSGGSSASNTALGPLAPSPQSVGASVRNRAKTAGALPAPASSPLSALQARVAAQVKKMGGGYSTRIVNGVQQLLKNGKVIATG
jgi:hypothetical protein